MQYGKRASVQDMVNVWPTAYTVQMQIKYIQNLKAPLYEICQVH